MALVITKKTRTILFIVLGVLVIGGGGFLFWRINQEDTVAPEDSEAGQSECPDGSYYITDAPGEDFCVNGKLVPRKDVKPGCYQSYYDSNLGGNCWKPVSSPKPPPPTKYTLKYTAGTGGSITGSTTQSVEKSKSGTQVTAVPNTGYTFTKWSDGKTTTSRTDSNVQGNITVNAEFEAQTSTYTVKYQANGGKCDGRDEVVRKPESGKTATAPKECVRTGYTHTGFTKASGDCGNLQDNGNVKDVTCDIILNANWVKQKYTVTYEGNGGTCTPSSRMVEYMKNSEVPDCERSGFYVAKFVRTAGGAVGRLNSETGWVGDVTGDQTITARWSKTCGDGTCSSDENANTCPTDCPAVCPDGYCTHDETVESCPEDCTSECGDGVCSQDENSENCLVDCPVESGDESPDEDPDEVPGVVTQNGSVPQTGLLDTVLGRISLGISFIFLGGLVSQYSRINYLFNSMAERREFKKDVRREKRREARILKRREKLEERFK